MWQMSVLGLLNQVRLMVNLCGRRVFVGVYLRRIFSLRGRGLYMII